MENPDRTLWYQRFNGWLAQSRPALEVHNFREGLVGYPHIVNQSVPWTAWERVGKPLAEARLGLVSTAGVYIEGAHEPFDAHSYMGDTSYRTLPWNVDPARLRIAHEHYDHAAANQDLGSVLPLDLLRALAADGVVGGLVEPIFSLSGYILDAWALKETTAREIAFGLAQAGADAALVVPV